jgi:hypothetical protein
LRQQIFELREKAIAYSVKSQKIEVEKKIVEREQQEADPEMTVQESSDRLEEVREKIFKCQERLMEEREGFDDTMIELHGIVEGQRAAIVEYLRTTV